MSKKETDSVNISEIYGKLNENILKDDVSIKSEDIAKILREMIHKQKMEEQNGKDNNRFHK